ncbi:hypothetical protein ColTof4_02423 [Colletotrichum tofieldiae]|nr:hypothetical protein ColTof3_09287 [Colletotrichum tofieldiae]GKT70000.1 hypothetical protein ColTof4_02423 [Colletotrichum tofieldiae]
MILNCRCSSDGDSLSLPILAPNPLEPIFYVLLSSSGPGPPQSHYAISSYGNDDDDVFYIVQAVLHTLNEHNVRSPRVTKTMVRMFASRVFHDWNTDRPIPVPADRPHQLTHDRCSLRFRRILISSPPLIRRRDTNSRKSLISFSEPPAHRRRGQPAFLRPVIGIRTHRCGFGFMWTDSQGGKLPRCAVILDRGVTMWIACNLVQMHYDRNEHKRIMEWNTNRAIYWARQRLLNFARNLNSIFIYDNGNRYRCADEYVHSLQRALLCRDVLEQLHNTAEDRYLEPFEGTASWGWREPSNS